MYRQITGINGADFHQYGQGGVIAIVSVLMVFAILLIIILLTEAIGNAINKATPVAEVATQTNAPVATSAASPLNINDEDATVAALVASIDYRNETKKNIQVISVREVK